MTFRVIMENPGGELDSAEAADGRDAVRVLVKMLEDCGELSDGDVFRIIDNDEERG